MMFSSLIITLFSMVIFIGLRKYVLRPISIISSGLNNASHAGRLSQKIVWESKDEFGMMTNLFNNMIEDIDTYQNKLEDLVKDRTHELEKFSKVIDHSSFTVVITDTKGNIEYVNPAFTRVTGYSFNEAIGQNVKILNSGKTDSSVFDDLWRTISQGLDWSGEFCNVTKHGKLFWENVGISPIMNESGKITNFVAVKEDITESKALRETLENSENRLRRVIDSSPAMIFIKDTKGIYRTTNTAYEKFADVSKEELVGKSLFEIYEPERAKDFYDNDMAIVNTGETIIRDIEMMKNGRQYYLLETKFPIFDTNGSIVEIGGWVLDITERVKAEKEAKIILDSVGDGIIGINKEANAIFVNPAALRILGYEKEAVIGVNINTLIALNDNDVDRENGKAKTDFSNPQIVNQDIYLINEEKVINVEVSSLPMQEGDELIGSVVIIRDVSEQKKMTQLLEDVFNSISVPLFVTDVESGEILKFNRACQEFHGVSTDLMFKTPIQDAYVNLETDRPQLIEAFENNSQIEVDLKRFSTNEIRHCLSQGSKINYEGKPALLGSFIDITEMKLAQERVIHSEQQLKALFEALPLGVVMIGNEGQILEANEVSEEILGISADEHKMRDLQSKEWKIVDENQVRMDPEDYPASRAARGEGLIKNVEMGSFRPDGSLVWISTSAAPISKEYGGGVAVAFEDITKEKLQKEETQRALNKVETLYNATVLFQNKTNLTDILEIVLDNLKKVVPFETASIQEFIDGEFEIIHCKGFEHPENINGIKFPIDEGSIADSVYTTKQPVIIGDISNHSEFADVENSGIKSWLGIPLIHEGNIMGKLTLDSREYDFYNDEMAATGMAFAFQAAMAIRNSRYIKEITEAKELAEQGKKELEKLIFQSEISLELTKSGYWHVPLMDDPGYYISSERGTAIFGDLPRESKRYDLDTEWMAHVRAGNEEAAEATAKKL